MCFLFFFQKRDLTKCVQYTMLEIVALRYRTNESVPRATEPFPALCDIASRLSPLRGKPSSMEGESQTGVVLRSH